MKKGTVAKWIVGSVFAAAATAFAVGVALELKAIRKLTVDVDSDEEPKASDLAAEVEAAEDVKEQPEA